MESKRGLFVSLAGALVGFGMVMIYSASITSWPTEFERIQLSRQMGALAVGLVVATICAQAPADFWRRAAPALLAVTVVLLAAVLVPGIGARVNGARRWLRCAGFQFQPSELAKIALPLFLCRQLQKTTAESWGVRRILGMIVAPVALTAGLVMAEPDLGTSVFLGVVAAIALFISGCPLRYFAGAALLAVPAAGFLALLRPYQMRRLTGFWAAWSDWSNVPYQLDQSIVSLGAGGIFGVGLGKGWQKLSFLPEANTDFVFAVVGEELGLVATLSLIVLWGLLYYAGLRLVRETRADRFASTAIFVLVTQLALQALANMAVVTALIPPKGIPLPLVSYGGSALVMSLTSLGIVCSLSRAGETESALAAQCRTVRSA